MKYLTRANRALGEQWADSPCRKHLLYRIPTKPNAQHIWHNFQHRNIAEKLKNSRWINKPLTLAIAGLQTWHISAKPSRQRTHQHRVGDINPPANSVCIYWCFAWDLQGFFYLGLAGASPETGEGFTWDLLGLYLWLDHWPHLPAEVCSGSGQAHSMTLCVGTTQWQLDNGRVNCRSKCEAQYEEEMPACKFSLRQFLFLQNIDRIFTVSPRSWRKPLFSQLREYKTPFKCWGSHRRCL